MNTSCMKPEAESYKFIHCYVVKQNILSLIKCFSELRESTFLRVRLAAHVSFARHGRALAGESPEHAQVVGNV